MMLQQRKWLNGVVITGAAQVAIQGLGFLGGILVIRSLPVHEYALYTLANTMLGTITILADGGLTIAVMAQGGKVWRRKEDLGLVLSTGMVLRRKFSAFSLFLAVPVLIYLLRKHDASLLTSALIVLALVTSFLLCLSGALLEVPLKLHQDLKPLQRFQIESYLIRLFLLGLTIFVFPFAALAIACAGIGQIWHNRRLSGVATDYIGNMGGGDKKISDEILSSVRKTFPGAVYYSISSQLSVWLISIFGASENIAQIGALGRLAILLAPLSTIINIVIVPRFARLSNDGAVALLKSYFLIHSLLALIIVVVLTITWTFPEAFLSVLGDNYKQLRRELVLMSLATAVGVAAGSAYSLNACRGHIFPASFFFPIVIFFQILSIRIMPLDTLSGVINQMFFLNAIAYLLHLLFGVSCFWRNKKP